MKLPLKYRDLIIVRADGGICSQILFVALGRYLQSRGFRVKFDLSFFHNNAKDLTGMFARNWDIPKAFPQLRIDEASGEEIQALKGCCTRIGNNISSFSAPLYVGGYFELNDLFINEIFNLRSMFSPTYGAEMGILLRKISEHPSCAVHVRRGDLVSGNPYYGGATTEGYFNKAITIVRAIEPQTHFFFFSDEPEWVRENLIGDNDLRDMCEVVNLNGSDAGYLDLFAMSRCDRIISSIGSLGPFAAFLSEYNKCLVMSHKRDWVMENLPNVIYLNDDYGRRAIPIAENEFLEAIPEPKLHGISGRAVRLCFKVLKCLTGEL